MVREAAHSTKESAASSLNAGRGEGGEVVVVVEETFEELSSRDEAIASCCAEGGMYIDEDVTVGWSETFETGTELDSVLYQNETNLVFDETVSSLVINFRAQFPYSSTVEDLIGNDTNQVRYVEARLWEPGSQQSGGVPFWEVRATQDYPGERWDWQLDFIEGTWVLEVEARGWGVTTPVEQLSFHDSFDLYATMTKPCVHFPSSHEFSADGEMECTFLSELED